MSFSTRLPDWPEVEMQAAKIVARKWLENIDPSVSVSETACNCRSWNPKMTGPYHLIVVLGEETVTVCYRRNGNFEVLSDVDSPWVLRVMAALEG